MVDLFYGLHNYIPKLRRYISQFIKEIFTNNGPPGKILEFPEKSAPYSGALVIVTASITLSILLLGTIYFSRFYLLSDPIFFPAQIPESLERYEPIIEWIPGILVIACTYNALWMVASYCTRRSSFFGVPQIIYTLRKSVYGPYQFLEWIFLVYLALLIIELMSGDLKIMPSEQIGCIPICNMSVK